MPGLPAPLCVNGPALSAGGFLRCVSEGSMSAMERTTYRVRFECLLHELQDPSRAWTSGPFAEVQQTSILVYLSDLQDQAGGLVVSAFAIMVDGILIPMSRRVIVIKGNSIHDRRRDQGSSVAGHLEPTGCAPNTAER